MANPYYGQKTGGGMRNPAKTGSGMKAKEKPAFPSASLPGKSGPDRSAGIKKCKVDPKRIGL